MNFPISFGGKNLEGTGIVSDISINGCAFVTQVQLTEKSTVRSALRISDELEPVDIEVAVVRHVRQGHVGSEFLRVQEAEATASIVHPRPSAQVSPFTPPVVGAQHAAPLQISSFAFYCGSVTALPR